MTFRLQIKNPLAKLVVKGCTVTCELREGDTIRVCIQDPARDTDVIFTCNASELDAKLSSYLLERE